MAKQVESSSESAEMRVVGLGASAGGITALQGLFRGLRPHPALSFVVIQHLAPDVPSWLVHLMRQWSKLPVREALEGERLEPGQIYIAAPGPLLTLENGMFRARSAESRHAGLDTIDVFFESLAREWGPKAIAVVLSGSGADGAAGAVCIRRAGGIVIVQDPLTATHDGMPRAVIDRGAADYILPLKGIAEQLLDCGSPSYIRPQCLVSETAQLSRALDAIVELVRKRAGSDLSGYKPTVLLWRVQQRMDIRRVRSFVDYEALLRDDPVELEALVRGIPIHVTGFFRDPSTWDAFAEEVIEPLLSDCSAGDSIRTWTPACATGEEAYSLAMILSERAEALGRALNFQVFATDVSPEIVARASRGAFTKDALLRITPQRRARFFYEADGLWRVQRSLRDKMVFATQDLLTDPPFSNLHLITCRNLLIYLEPAAIQHVLSMFHSALRPGGYLLLGDGEALSPRQKGFEPDSTRRHVYRRTGTAVDIPLVDSGGLKHITGATAIAASAHWASLENFNLPSVLIDDEFQILRVYGDTREILRLPAGEPTYNLLNLVHPQLSSELELAVHKALATHLPLTAGLREHGGEVWSGIRLTPLQSAVSGCSPRLLVSFIRDRDFAHELTDRCREAAPSQQRSSQEWQDAVRLSREELEASREELQALNEELNASNEQLNSANEHLARANAELQGKIAELQMQSRVLSSGEVATLFLDQDLRVRWFTSAMSNLFPLKPEDAGRHITDLAQRFEARDFIVSIHHVMHTGETHEAEVRNVANRWFLLRISPYIQNGERAAGVAITFTDITERRQAESELRRTEAFVAAQKEAFQAAVNNAPLQESLGILVRGAIAQLGDDVRTAFYLADGAGLQLHHVTGLPEDHPLRVEGFKAGSDSLASGLAMHTGRPVITSDVTGEPRWREWLALAGDCDVRACWSFPIETTAGKIIGTFAIYHRQPRAATPRDLELATLLTRAAAVIVSRHHEAEKRAAAEAALRKSGVELTRELNEAQARLRERERE